MSGKVDVLSSGPTPTITIDGESATINAGGNGKNGGIVVKHAAGTAILTLQGSGGKMLICRPNGQPLIDLSEDLRVYDTSGNPRSGQQEHDALHRREPPPNDEAITVQPSSGFMG